MGVAEESSLKLENGGPYLRYGLFRVERHETTVRHDRGLRRARSYKRSTDRHLRKYRSELIMTPLRVEPAYDPIRGDTRFQEMLRRVGLAEGEFNLGSTPKP